MFRHQRHYLIVIRELLHSYLNIRFIILFIIHFIIIIIICMRWNIAFRHKNNIFFIQKVQLHQTDKPLILFDLILTNKNRCAWHEWVAEVFISLKRPVLTWAEHCCAEDSVWVIVGHCTERKCTCTVERDSWFLMQCVKHAIFQHQQCKVERSLAFRLQLSFNEGFIMGKSLRTEKISTRRREKKLQQL